MYAKIVVDIHHTSVDRLFTYRIPPFLDGEISVGSLVEIPFGKGNTLRRGYVVRLTAENDLADEKTKEIHGIVKNSLALEEKQISLALYIKRTFGGTLSQCLSTVLPEKVKVTRLKPRFVRWIASPEVLQECLTEAVRKKHYAKERLFRALQTDRVIPYTVLTERLSVSKLTLDPLQEKGYLEIYTEERPLVDTKPLRQTNISLNDEQKKATEGITKDPRTGHLLFGVTGSGKTEVYLKLIEQVMEEGKEAIVLLPEIALTYQTVMRFYHRFGSYVSVVHSKLSRGEKSERFQAASEGNVRIMIGPRSALFTPFHHLGLIIIDEFHESSFDAEQSPPYKSTEVALEMAKREGAKVVFGSATPSVSYYYRALQGEFSLQRLKKRAVPGSHLPLVTVVDMRAELEKKNFSVFSELLKDEIEDRLQKNEQVMLFLNRRGYSGSVSCRTCGKPIICPHCSVAMSFHKPSRMVCHICGYEETFVKVCPACGSNKIGSFGIGTEKVEEQVQSVFPLARTVRMDGDTTATKNGSKEILEKFSGGEANVLIGTQMIVKGHDFPRVTLVGVLAADMSLHVPDYRSAERTFQLLTQAEGRAGRAETPGRCIVQTYEPEHYAIQEAKNQDFEAFYREELAYRDSLHYPPAGAMMKVRIYSRDERKAQAMAERLVRRAQEFTEKIRILGPKEDVLYKAKDVYYMAFYLKGKSNEELLCVKEELELCFDEWNSGKDIGIIFGGT